jgi:type II secretory pathway pseudopilin PulG
LTLIELVVVMTILIALGGLLVPMFASMLTRGHTSTCSTNIGEVSKAVEQYQLLYGTYPNNLDSFIDTSGALITYFANGAACPAQYLTPGIGQAGGQVTLGTPTAAETTALLNAGITTVMPMATYAALSTGFDPTFNYYADYLNPGATTLTPTSVATASSLAYIDPTSGNTAAIQICNKLGWALTGRYVVLGVGTRNTMVGKTMVSAPVHYGDQPVLNPEYGYQHIVAVFKVSDSATSAFTTAQMVGAGPLHDIGLGTINDELQNWYQLENNGS